MLNAKIVEEMAHWDVDQNRKNNFFFYSNTVFIDQLHLNYPHTEIRTSAKKKFKSNLTENLRCIILLTRSNATQNIRMF